MKLCDRCRVSGCLLTYGGEPAGRPENRSARTWCSPTRTSSERWTTRSWQRSYTGCKRKYSCSLLKDLALIRILTFPVIIKTS